MRLSRPLGSLGVLAVTIVGGCGGAADGGAARSVSAANAAACAPMTDPAPPTKERPRQVLQGVRTAGITSVVASPNGRYLATTEHRASGFAIWDAASRALLRRYRRGNPVENDPPSLRWEDDGHLLVESTGLSYVSDLKDDVPQPKLPQESGTRGARGPYRWIACNDAACELRQADGKAVGGLPRLPKGIDSIWDLVVSADGRTAALADGKRVLVWRRQGDRFVAASPVEVPGEVRSVALPPSGEALIVSARANGRTAVLHVAAPGRAPEELPLPPGADAGNVSGFAIAADGGRAAAIAGDGIAVWDLVRRRLVWSLNEPARVAPVFVEGGRRLVVKSERRGLLSVDAASGRVQGTFGGASQIREVHHAIPLDADRLVAWGRDVVTVWSLREARRVASYPMHDLEKVEVSPRGDLMLWSQGHLAACQAQKDRGLYSPGSRLEVWAGLTPPPKATPPALRPTPGQGPPATGAWPKAPPFAIAFCNPATMYDVSFAQGLMLVEAGSRVGVLDLATGSVRPLENADWVHGEHASDPGAIALAGAGKWVVAAKIGRPEGGNNGAIVGRWDARTGKPDAQILDVRPASEFNPLRANPRVKLDVRLATSRDGSAAIVGDDTFLGVYGFGTGSKEHPQKGARDIYHAVFGVDASTQLVSRGDASFSILGKGGPRTGTSDFGGLDSAQMSPDGSYVAATTPGGALTIWDGRTAAFRAVLADFDDEEWAISTPDGAYTGTAEVADRVGWVFDEPAEHFGFEQFASFRDPQAVARRLSGAAGERTYRVSRPPRVSLGATPETTSAVTLRLRAHTLASGGRVDVVRAFVEGRPVAEQRVCKAEADVELEVPLVAGANRVNVVAFDHLGLASNAAVADVVSTRSGAARPDAFVLAVGVNQYPNLPREMSLAAATADASGIAAAFKRMEGTTYGRVATDVLTDAAATPSSIRASLAKLAAMKPEDVGIVFLAGHGFKPAATEDMVFVTGGVRLRPDGKGPTKESLATDALGWRDIAAAIASARGRVLVLLDACHSGHVNQELVVPNEALANTLVREKRAGAVVFTAAKGRQYSLEPGSERALVLDETSDRPRAPGEPAHGYFTGAFLASLAARDTDRNGDGALQLSELIDETTRRVRELSRGEQTPWIARRDLFGDFTVAAAAPSR